MLSSQLPGDGPDIISTHRYWEIDCYLSAAIKAIYASERPSFVNGVSERGVVIVVQLRCTATW